MYKIISYNVDGNILRGFRYNNDLWFRANEVARLLGYENTRQAIIRHVEAEDKLLLYDVKKNSNREFNEQGHQVLVNLDGLYTIIATSTKPEAQQLQQWLDQQLFITADEDLNRRIK